MYIDDKLIPRKGLNAWAEANGFPVGFKLMEKLDWLRWSKADDRPQEVRYGRDVYYPESELLRYKAQGPNLGIPITDVVTR